jgi:glutaredoxin 3
MGGVWQHACGAQPPAIYFQPPIFTPPRPVLTCGAAGMIRHSVTEVSYMPKVEIYTQPWCPFCERAVHILSTKSVEFQEIEAPHGSAAREDAKRRSGGRTTMPQIFIDDRHIGGCDDLIALDRAGKLDPLLRAA